MDGLSRRVRRTAMALLASKRQGRTSPGPASLMHHGFTTLAWAAAPKRPHRIAERTLKAPSGWRQGDQQPFPSFACPHLPFSPLQQGSPGQMKNGGPCGPPCHAQLPLSGVSCSLSSPWCALISRRAVKGSPQSYWVLPAPSSSGLAGLIPAAPGFAKRWLGKPIRRAAVAVFFASSLNLLSAPLSLSATGA